MLTPRMLQAALAKRLPALSQAGCKAVVFADMNVNAAATTADESQSFAADPTYRAFSVGVDVTNIESVQNMVDVTVKEFGRVDYCVNVAGIANLSANSTANTNLEDFNRIVDTNLMGTAYCVQAVIKAMLTQDPQAYVPPKRGNEEVTSIPSRSLGRGVIINIGSVYSQMAQYSSLAYSAAKHGVIGITKVAALDHARDGIRVNAVLPGATETPLFKGVLERHPKMRDGIKANVPWEGRMASVREVACAVTFLCSAGASYITGASLLVDGGVSLTHPGSGTKM